MLVKTIPNIEKEIALYHYLDIALSAKLVLLITTPSNEILKIFENFWSSPIPTYYSTYVLRAVVLAFQKKDALLFKVNMYRCGNFEVTKSFSILV